MLYELSTHIHYVVLFNRNCHVIKFLYGMDYMFFNKEINTRLVNKSFERIVKLYVFVIHVYILIPQPDKCVHFQTESRGINSAEDITLDVNILSLFKATYYLSIYNRHIT